MLGDIVGSKANPVSRPQFPYADQFNAGYGTFKSTYTNRKTVVVFNESDVPIWVGSAATVTNTGAGGFLTVWPTGEPRPFTATHNFVPGLTIGNLVLAKVGANGRVSIFNSSGATHVIVNSASDRDLIVADVDLKVAPGRLVWGSGPDQLIKELPNVGMDGDRFYRPLFASKEFLPFTGTVLHVDPSGRGRDRTATPGTTRLARSRSVPHHAAMNAAASPRGRKPRSSSP